MPTKPQGRCACGNRSTSTGRGRCTTCAAEYERTRGTKQQRGYDKKHDALRRRWAPRVATGAVQCWRCGELIAPGQQWDLGHDDDDRSITRGPEHAAACNRAAGGRAAHARRA